MAYSAEKVTELFQNDEQALDEICMEGSDDDLGMEDVEVIDQEYDDFVDSHGK